MLLLYYYIMAALELHVEFIGSSKTHSKMHITLQHLGVPLCSIMTVRKVYMQHKESCFQHGIGNMTHENNLLCFLL